jgi:hypothetical protein
VITLKEDDADAVEEVLRRIYGCALPQANDKQWRFWFTLVAAADKYLEPALSDSAASRLMESAEAQTSADAIFDIIQEIKASMSHHESLLNFAERLRVTNLNQLLQNSRYRGFLISDPERMLAQLDELEVPRDLSEKEYFTCNQCVRWLFCTPGELTTRMAFCAGCHTKKNLSCHTAYLPKK